MLDGEMVIVPRSVGQNGIGADVAEGGVLMDVSSFIAMSRPLVKQVLSKI